MGIPTLISTATASSASDVEITSGIDNTYDEYMFVCTDIHLDTDDKDFNFNGSIDGGSNYNVAKTTAQFRAYHDEDDSATALEYNGGGDLAQATGDQRFMGGIAGGAIADASISIIMHLFNPSNTTYVKHFYMTAQAMKDGPKSSAYYTAGYFNTTSAIDALIFRCDSGTFDGVIQMYGIA